MAGRHRVRDGRIGHVSDDPYYVAYEIHDVACLEHPCTCDPSPQVAGAEAQAHAVVVDMGDFKVVMAGWQVELMRSLSGGWPPDAIVQDFAHCEYGALEI